MGDDFVQGVLGDVHAIEGLAGLEARPPSVYCRLRWPSSERRLFRPDNSTPARARSASHIAPTLVSTIVRNLVCPNPQAESADR